jgi:hypothetical protein
LALVTGRIGYAANNWPGGFCKVQRVHRILERVSLLITRETVHRRRYWRALIAALWLQQ